MKAKILRYEHVDVASVFDKESEILAQIQNGQLNRALILWQSRYDTLVLPSGNKWQQSDELKAQLAHYGWQLYARKTGGAPVPQRQGVINISYMYTIDANQDYSIPDAYRSFCDKLSLFFAHFGIKVDAHATPGSYCDGDYNLNINKQKIVGTAQRVVLKKGGGKVVLAQACILINASMDELIAPVNLCYQLHQQHEQVLANVHTCLFEHTNQRPDTSQLYQTLIQCFSD